MNYYFYAIMPISADNAFQKKIGILDSIAKDFEIDTHFPFESDAKRFKDICDNIKKAQFVIADLSFERPSCYYELGLVQGLGKKTILIAQKGTYIHQKHGQVKYYKDIRDYEKIIQEEVGKIYPNKSVNRLEKASFHSAFSGRLLRRYKYQNK